MMSNDGISDYEGITVDELFKAQKFIPSLRKCAAFYDCINKRDGLDPLKPGEKRPKHCYWPKGLT